MSDQRTPGLWGVTINKGMLKFPNKKEAMVIDEDPFLPIASINTASFDLRALIESKNA